MEAQAFLRTIIEALVTDTQSIEISEKHDELGTLLSLKVHSSDMGAIIGRGGKTIDALRIVLRIFGSKNNQRVNLRIIEDQV